MCSSDLAYQKKGWDFVVTGVKGLVIRNKTLFLEILKVNEDLYRAILPEHFQQPQIQIQVQISTSWDDIDPKACPEITREAAQQRGASTLRNNFATVCASGSKGKKTYTKSSPGANAKVQHSERLALKAVCEDYGLSWGDFQNNSDANNLALAFKQKSVVINWIFTEREPCPGDSGCRKWLAPLGTKGYDSIHLVDVDNKTKKPADEAWNDHFQSMRDAAGQ